MLGTFRLSLLSAVFVAAASVACGPASNGAITPSGYQNAAYEYSVAALPDGNLMSPEWKLDNYYLKRKQLVEKDSKDYVVTFELDKEGDGEYETKAKQYLYDLRFKNLVHDGTIFVRTIPISTDLGQKKLSVLMQNYIEAIAGGGYEVVQLNPQDRIVIEKRYAAAVDDQGPATLAGLPAHVATLSVANTEQLKVDPKARAERVQLVLMHTRFVYHPKGTNKKVVFPVLLLAGYANQPDDFDAGLVEFHQLLNRVVIEGAHGYSYVPPAPAAAPAPSATPAPAPEGAAEQATPPAAAPAPAAAGPASDPAAPATAAPPATAPSPTPAPAAAPSAAPRAKNL